MAGIATIARAMGHEVSGSDAQAYPPMSDLLEQAGIAVQRGYDPEHLKPAPDCVVIGNALTRGNPAVEYVLNERLRYTSGPQWLAENVLRDRQVLAVAGTHGKTTTSSILAWVLEHAGCEPGFLIGGLAKNFGISARLGNGAYFVIEADEYDTAFFDKRSKFVHYHAQTLIINNVEYDHADIFPDIESIHRQFHHLVRTLPSSGTVIRPTHDAHIDTIMQMGCWSKIIEVGAPHGCFRAEMRADDGSHFVLKGPDTQAEVRWTQYGAHNVANALAACAAASCAGVSVAQSAAALAEFTGISRRLEVRGVVQGITLYDDFAHHPTAIEATIDALRKHIARYQPPRGRIVAILEPRSNTMRLGVHRDTLAPALCGADSVFALLPPELDWSLPKAFAAAGVTATFTDTVDELVQRIAAEAKEHDHLLVMSNGSFGGLHDKLLDALQPQANSS